MTLITDKGVVFAPSSDLGDITKGLDYNLETCVRGKLKDILQTCYDRGDRLFITYMESWWGIVTAEEIVALKHNYSDITFATFVCHRGGERDYPHNMRQRYYGAISKADMDICTGGDCDNKTTIPQNQIIVSIASTIIDYNIGSNSLAVGSTDMNLEALAVLNGVTYINLYRLLP